MRIPFVFYGKERTLESLNTKNISKQKQDVAIGTLMLQVNEECISSRAGYFLDVGVVERVLLSFRMCDEKRGEQIGNELSTTSTGSAGWRFNNSAVKSCYATRFYLHTGLATCQDSRDEKRHPWESAGI